MVTETLQDPNTAIVLTTLAFAFSNSIRNEVRKRQKNACAECGRVGKLQVHHRVPQCMGGDDTIENAIGLCPRCHSIADWEALHGRIIYPQLHFNT